MLALHELPARSAEAFRGAAAAEGRAAACERELARHFEERNMERLASLCRRLEKRHARSAQTLRDAGIALPQIDARWLDSEPRDFVLRVAGPRQLLEVACAAEAEAADLYGHVAREVPAATREEALHLAAHARHAVEEMSEAIRSLPGAPDWEGFIEAGGGPALALGAERRLRR